MKREPLFPRCTSCRTTPVYHVTCNWNGYLKQCCEVHKPGSRRATADAFTRELLARAPEAYTVTLVAK